MNQIMLYHLWRRVEFQKYSDGVLYRVGAEDIPQIYDDGSEDGADNVPVGDVLVRYHLETSTTSLDEAQEACFESNGQLVYTFSEAWYGSQS